MRTLLLLAGLLGASCATVNVNGHDLLKGLWERDSEELKSRASFDLKCSERDLRLKVLSTTDNRSIGPAASQVGVEGCGKRMAYVHTPNGFVANSQAEE